jgi:hypothetical protein
VSGHHNSSTHLNGSGSPSYAPIGSASNSMIKDRLHAAIPQRGDKPMLRPRCRIPGEDLALAPAQRANLLRELANHDDHRERRRLSQKMRRQTSPIPVRLHQRWFLSGEHAAREYCGAPGHAAAPTRDGGRIATQSVYPIVGPGAVNPNRPRTRRHGRHVFEPRRSQGGQCGKGNWDSVYAVDHGGVRCTRGRAKKRRAPPGSSSTCSKTAISSGA